LQNLKDCAFAQAQIRVNQYIKMSRTAVDI
jgi:hypothetical protein